MKRLLRQQTLAPVLPGLEQRTAPEPQPVNGDQPALRLRGITKHWRGMPAPVLDNVDLDVLPGRLVWLGGRNGVGKTTLLRITAGLIGADAGSISVYGLHPERDRRRYQQATALLSAGDRGLYARLKVHEQLEFTAGLNLIVGEGGRAAVERALRRFDLEELRDRRLDRISMGQRQRVRLAMTFLADPDLVLLDEPGTSLDEDGLALLADAVAELVGRGGAAVWCSPAFDGSPLQPDEGYVLDGGRLEAV